MPILVAKKLIKTYPGKKAANAVNDISFHLDEGEILGLAGPNGSGKTTTIQMLLGTLTYTSGSVHYFGKELQEYRTEILQNVSFASTYTSLPWLLTIEENLIFFGCLYGYSGKESARRFNPLLERFGILNKKKDKVASLSAGQVTRLMLVKAFFIQPKVVLLDEPTASLDPEIAQDICAFLLEQRNENKLSILFTSHKMQEVMEICDRTIFLKDGKIIANDVPGKLAGSVSGYIVKLMVIEGLERLMILVRNAGYSFSINQKNIEIKMEEKNIPLFLNQLGNEKITCESIKIEEPSLEDFFLQIAKIK